MADKVKDRQCKRVALPDEGGTILRIRMGADYRIDENGCWIWQRNIDPQGYGRLAITQDILEQRAHREYYRRAHGPIPFGWHVHHKCETPACVNPEHLEAKGHSPHLAYHKQAISSLSWDDVNAIRAAFTAGEQTQYEIATAYGIAQPTLSDIITNTTWVDPSYTPGRVATCVECGVEFLAHKSNHRFCCDLHRKRNGSRRRWRERRAAA